MVRGKTGLTKKSYRAGLTSFIRNVLRPFLIKMVSRYRGHFGIVFLSARYVFSFFSFLIKFGIAFGIVFGIAAIPTIPVSLVFLPRDTKTKVSLVSLFSSHQFRQFIRMLILNDILAYIFFCS